MHDIVKNLLNIDDQIKLKVEELNISSKPKIIAVSKTFKIEKIMPLIEYGHLDYGENKVQEAVEKWTEVKKNRPNLNLHLIGKLQTNKVKFAVQLFDYIHSLDSERLAKKISEEQNKFKKKMKIFIQINIGDEEQKSGIKKKQLKDFKIYCNELGLNIIGTMCIPPLDAKPEKYFLEMYKLNQDLELKDLSMGMSSDYIDAIKYSSTYLRIGTSIFGSRF